MAVKKRICYKERLKSCNPNTINGIIEGRITTENTLRKRMEEEPTNGTLEQRKKLGTSKRVNNRATSGLI